MRDAHQDPLLLLAALRPTRSGTNLFEEVVIIHHGRLLRYVPMDALREAGVEFLARRTARWDL